MAYWIEKNIMKMMWQVMQDARYQRPMPLSITMHEKALDKFIEILKSKSSYFPDENGKFKFIGIPVYTNNKLPFGSFTVERMKTGSGMILSK